MSKDQLRSSQMITTYGPGSMVDFPETSVIIAGLDLWSYDNSKIPIIEEPRLIAKLQQLLHTQNIMLRKPPPASDEPQGPHPNVVGWRFPEWFIVQRAETSRGFKRRRLVHLNSLNGNRFTDYDQTKQSVVPVRFVRACRRGHVGDIDWKTYVHRALSQCPRDLWFEERGTSGDLDQVWVVCECGAERVMSDAARPYVLGTCNGSRPWLGTNTSERCEESNRLLIRSASNAYFAERMSVISIPDRRGPVDEVVRALWEDFLFDVQTNEDLTRIRMRPTVANRLQNLDDADVMRAIVRRRSGSTEIQRPVKEVEFEALAEARDELGSDVPEGDFYARVLPRSAWGAEWLENVERVVLVHRLREVSAQVGFTRFEASGPDIQGELSLDVRRAPLALDASWLPAIENRGEGIFIQIRSDAIQAWMQRPALQSRRGTLLAGFNRWKDEHEITGAQFPDLPYYLLHSLSHLLITAVSLECGYPASSIKERIYASNGRYGILIYTGSSDAEGTLGGLVLAGRDIRRHLLRAFEIGSLCSNDPVCALHNPDSPHQPLLGSACHGCLLISETSCEQRNDFLDRALVVETVDRAGTEFFTGVSL